MKKLLNLMAFIAIALLVSNCGSNEAKTPATLEKSFYSELQKGNYEKAADLIIVDEVDGYPVVTDVLVDGKPTASVGYRR